MAGRLFSFRFFRFPCQRLGRCVLLGWNEISLVFLNDDAVKDVAVESGQWQILEFQSLKF